MAARSRAPGNTARVEVRPIWAQRRCVLPEARADASGLLADGQRPPPPAGGGPSSAVRARSAHVHADYVAVTSVAQPPLRGAVGPNALRRLRGTLGPRRGACAGGVVRVRHRAAARERDGERHAADADGAWERSPRNGGRVCMALHGSVPPAMPGVDRAPLGTYWRAPRPDQVRRGSHSYAAPPDAPTELAASTGLDAAHPPEMGNFAPNPPTPQSAPATFSRRFSPIAAAKASPARLSRGS